MKCIAGAAAVGHGICQRAYHLVEFNDGARPTMRHDQRQCIGFVRPYMKEMNAEAIDRRAILSPTVQHGLAAAPIVARTPVLTERLHSFERRALAPVIQLIQRFAFRPPRANQSITQFVEFMLRNRQ